MRLIIKVPGKMAEEVRAFMDAIKRPVRPHKGIPGVVVRAVNGSSVNELVIRGINIKVKGLPETKFAVGDVVENTKSGNWGKITDIRADGLLIVKSSKASLAETGNSVMEFLPSEAAHLV